MTQEHFNHLLNTRPGIGAECVTASGNTVRYFYENFPDDRGITRAMKQLYPSMQKGKLVKITFIDRVKSSQRR